MENNNNNNDDNNKKDDIGDKWNEDFQTFKFYCEKGYEYKIGIESNRFSVWIPLTVKEKQQLKWKKEILSNPEIIGKDFKCVEIIEHFGYFIGYDECDKERTAGVSLLINIGNLGTKNYNYIVIEGTMILFSAFNEIIEFKSPIHCLKNGPSAYPYAIDKKNILYTYHHYIELLPHQIEEFNHYSISEVPYYLELERKKNVKCDNLIEFISSFKNSVSIDLEEKKNHVMREIENESYDLCCDFPEINAKKELLQDNALKRILFESDQWKELKSFDLCENKYFRDYPYKQTTL